jgi:hypothetical protein
LSLIFFYNFCFCFCFIQCFPAAGAHARVGQPGSQRWRRGLARAHVCGPVSILSEIDRTFGSLWPAANLLSPVYLCILFLVPKGLLGSRPHFATPHMC